MFAHDAIVPPRNPTFIPIKPDDLVLGLVYGAGTETGPTQELLRERLRFYGYELRVVHLSDYFASMIGDTSFRKESPHGTRRLQDMGDLLRRETGDKSVLAKLAIYLIAAERYRRRLRGRQAWLVVSLKRPEEVDQLRAVYGPRFILLGVHVPEVLRRRTAAHRWQRWAPDTSQKYEDEATRDIRRDEHDPDVSHGQALRRTIALADFFIDARTDARLKETLPRTIRLIFGEPFEPPHRDEQAMYHAFTAGLRSAEMGRQVGAAIMSPSGEILVVGTNEVPAGCGGLYWSPDQPDGRDFALQPPLDSNTLWKRRIARELVVRMAKHEWLNVKRVSTLPATKRRAKGDERSYDVDEDQLDEFLRDVEGTRFSDITEFGRAVHAEMDALTTAARRGIAVEGATLVCTTFPCHGCARHLLASGIRRVLYIHPYAKSLAADLHEDALVIEPEVPGPIDGKLVFEQYIGVAPRGYRQYFDWGQVSRKTPRGRAVSPPDPQSVLPRVLDHASTFSFGGPPLPAARISQLEKEVARNLEKTFDEIRGLTLPTTEEDHDA
ncbi:MAG: deaminase [Actinomycetota bacterium]|nr:deaminase [Actinomycetota bacterium]MDQ5807550.1 deaminase [Actinomycetota bacterium]